jgi:hypothetical protein
MLVNSMLQLLDDDEHASDVEQGNETYRRPQEEQRCCSEGHQPVHKVSIDASGFRATY